MSVESSARLFSAPNVEGDTTHQFEIPFPSVGKVIHVAIKTLHIVGVTTFTLLCPYLSIGVSTLVFIAATSIYAKNKNEITKQQGYQTGFDETKKRQALEAMKESISLQNFSQVTSAVCICALAISSTVNPLLLVISTFFLTLNWVVNRTESKAFEHLKHAFDEQTASVEELHRLERVYPEVFDHSQARVIERVNLLKKERELRGQKQQYLHKVKDCVTNAWKYLLEVKMFTVEQGLEGDWYIFQPICRLAVIKELELKDIKLTHENIAPSLRKRIAQLKELRESFQGLTNDEKSALVSKVLTPEKHVSDKVLHLAHQTNALAAPMMQEQDLFQDPLIYGTENYCLKHLHIGTFLMLQKLKVERYAQKLFFKADDEPAAVEESAQEEVQPPVQGYLVINGQRLPIRSIQEIQ